MDARKPTRRKTPLLACSGRVSPAANESSQAHNDAGWRRAAAVGEELCVRGFGLDMRGLRHNHEVNKAMDALEKAAGLKDSETAVLEELATWAVIAVMKPARRAYWEGVFSSDTGKSWKALTEFPERIRRMAGELDALRSSLWFAPVEEGESPSLPSRLNDCADRIESQMEKIPMLENRALRRGTSQWKVQLSKRVKALTGRFRDREVAQLINAVDLALNGEGKDDSGVDAQTLTDLRSRRNRKAPKT